MLVKKLVIKKNDTNTDLNILKILQWQYGNDFNNNITCVTLLFVLFF